MGWKILVFILLFLPFVSAEIIIQDTFDSVYSIGDIVETNFSLDKLVDSSGYVETNLVCGNDEVLVSKQFLKVKANEKQHFDFSFPATIKGECYLEVNYKGEVVRSDKFEISSGINIEFFVSSKSVYPGEVVKLNGTAVKANDNFLEGVVKLYSDSVIEEKTFEVDDGEFNFEFSFGNQVKAGMYRVYLEALERDIDEEVINSGKVFFDVEVKQKPTKIEILSVDSIDPPGNISLIFRLVDQAGNLVENETILMKVFNPNRDIILEKTFNSESKDTFFFEGKALRGAWDFNFYYGNIFSSKQIYVGENPQVNAFVVINSGKSYLRITNEGNVAYQGVVLAKLENGEEVKEIPINVDLGVGETKDFILGFNGDYNLTFQGQQLGMVTLTGASVGLDFGGASLGYWVFFFVVFLAVVVFFIYKRKNFIGLFGKEKSGENKKGMYSQIFGENMVAYSGRKAFIVFFKYAGDFDFAKSIAARFGWSLRQVGEGIYFVLFYSSKDNSSEKIMNFVGLVVDRAKSKKENLCASVHMDRLEGKDDFLKNFSSVGKRLLGFSKNEVLVSKRFMESIEGLKGEVRYFEIEGKVLEVYSIKFN